MRWVTSSTSPMPSTSIRSPRPVDLDQRLGLLGVDLLPAADDVLGVVGATLDRGPLEQPLDELVVIDGEHHRGIEAVAGERDHAVELLDLGQGARVAVEQEAGLGVRLVDPVADHEVGDLVRDVVAGVHVAPGLPAEGVPWSTLARKMSPVEMAGIPKWSATNLAWVPFPAPGGPIMISRI